MLVSSTLNLYHSTDPARRDGEAIRRFVDEFGEPMTASERVAVCARTLDSKSVEPAIWHMNVAMVAMMRAMDRSEWSRTIGSANVGI
jgi:hypothetical protein